MAFNPKSVTETSGLGAKQELFVYLESLWVAFAFNRGWALRHGEGRILQLGADGKGRNARHALTGLPVKVKDRVHMDGSLHYEGLAADWNLFVGGQWASGGNHQAWKELGEFWENMHSLCRWGGRFSDANHISITHAGKS